MKSHLKSLAAPKTWVLLRKKNVFITRPKPGAHYMRLGMTLSLVFKNLIKQASTTREVKKILLNTTVSLDGRRVKDHRRIVGLMDVLTIPAAKLAFRIVLDDHGRLAAVPVPAKEENIKITKILDKRKVKKGKTQLDLIGGRTLVVDKDTYKTGDSLVIELPSQKIVASLKMDKDMLVYIIGGKHSGQKGTVQRIGGGMILFKNDKGKIITTLTKYALIIGKTKSVVQL